MYIYIYLLYILYRHHIDIISNIHIPSIYLSIYIYIYIHISIHHHLSTRLLPFGHQWGACELRRLRTVAGRRRAAVVLPGWKLWKWWLSVDFTCCLPWKLSFYHGKLFFYISFTIENVVSDASWMSKNRISAGWWSPWLLGGTSEMSSLRTWTKLELKLALLDGFAYWRFRDRKRPCPLANFTQFLRIESRHVFPECVAKGSRL